MSKLLNFDQMITPSIITVIYWIGVVFAVIGGLVFLLAGSGAVRLVGLIYIVIGPILWRVYCEFFIVVFKMNESLLAIRGNTSQEGAGGTV